MATYARVQGGTVMELFVSTGSIAALFNPAVTWVDVTSEPTVQVGWVGLPGGGFAAPVATPPAVPTVSLASVQAQLTALQAQVTALANAAA